MRGMENITIPENLVGPFARWALVLPKSLNLVLLITFLASFLLAACGSKTKTGTVIRFGQAVPSGGGLVQSYVVVKLDDGSEVKAWLPQDDKLWDAMRVGAKSGKTRVEIKRNGEFWDFVQALPYADTNQNMGKIVEGEIVTVIPKSRPQADGNSMGDPNAPVKIVAYSDFQCPPCKQFADNTEQELIESYIATGKVYLTYRSMGNFMSQTVGSGTESRDAAEASYCASDQGKFWEYKDILFANSLGKNEGYFARPRLEKMAEAIGLDLAQFKNCLDSKKHRDRIQQDFQDATSTGVKGVPTFLINGKLVEGYKPFVLFQKEIEAVMQGS